MTQRDPDVKAWLARWAETTGKEMRTSVFHINLVPGGGAVDRFQDIDYMLQVGASICMDKPLLVIAFEGEVIPPKLEKVADGIIRIPDTDTKSEVAQRALSEGMAAFMAEFFPE